MQTRRVLVCVLGVIVATSWPLAAQRNNDRGRQQQPPMTASRPPQEQADVDTLVRFVDSHQMSDPALPGLAAPSPAPAPAPAAAGAAPATPVLTAPPRQAPAFSLTWQNNHFIRSGAGTTFVPYTLKIDRAQLPASGVAYYIRVVDADQAAAFLKWAAAMLAPAPAPGNNRNAAPAPPPPQPSYAWQTINFIDLPAGDTIQRAVQLPPGKYVVYVAVKEKAPAPPPAPAANNRNNRNQPPAAAPAAAPPAMVGFVRKELDVPNYTTADLQLSSVLLATAIEPLQAQLPAAQQDAQPYVIGATRIAMANEHRFARAGTINLLFWIYGNTSTAAGKPDLTVDYNFYTKQGAGEKYFNKAPSQELNAAALPPEFKAGDPVVGALEGVPASVFPPGDYRLEIKVTDKPSGKSITQNVNFTVLPV
jgi:hypothetical protein